MRGGPRPNSGRKRGTKNRYSKELAARMRATGYAEPLDILLMIANDPSVPVEIRARAAKDAAVYVHRRKPVALEVSGRFEHLSPEEVKLRREQLLEEIRKRHAASPN